MPAEPQTARWTAEAANAWYAELPWLLGCNYTPRTAVNQLEMWQADTFDAETIDQELDWAASIGMNTLRVFLHDLAWTQDNHGFLDRLDHFLGIASQHGIRPMLVFFDSCWHPVPRAGKQRDPEAGVHNSFWLQSPGVPTLRDTAAFDKLEAYVTAVVGRFAKDKRVLLWDLWNEPDNSNSRSRGPRDIAAGKADVVAPLLRKTASWARAAKPNQPLTTGIWSGDWHTDDSLTLFEHLQLDLSDVISFHNYGKGQDVASKIKQLQRYGRPLLCSEYMARGPGSTFESVTPILKDNKVAAYNWGFVAGKTQTYVPWDSWQKPYTSEPPLWFHEIFHADGTPYRAEEVALLKKLTGRS